MRYKVNKSFQGFVILYFKIILSGQNPNITTFYIVVTQPYNLDAQNLNYLFSFIPYKKRDLNLRPKQLFNVSSE